MRDGFHGRNPRVRQPAMFVDLALLAVVIEAVVGYPDRIYRAIGHPVTWIARVITWADEAWNSDDDSESWRRHRGITLLALLVGGAFLFGILVSALLYFLLPTILGFIACAVLASSLLAQRSLESHVVAVA